MKFKIKKLIHYGNRDKAIVGKKYYFFDGLNTFIKNFNEGIYNVGILIEFNEDKEIAPFKICTYDDEEYTNYYSLLYPVEDEEEKKEPGLEKALDHLEKTVSLKMEIENAKKQAEKENKKYFPLGFNGLFALWKENPSMVVYIPSCNIWTTIRYFDLENEIVCIGGWIFTNDKRSYSDEYTFDKLKDINGNPFTTEYYPQFDI